MVESRGQPDAVPLILHVDDDEANRYAVSRQLRRAGFNVIEAGTGREAMAKVGQNPDLIILDVRLPDISGFEVCRQLKAAPATERIPVLHLSASLVKSEDKARGLDIGADGYLIRPVEPVELVATVNALLRFRRSEEALRQSEEKYRLAVQSVRDYAIFTLDPQGRVVSWNPGAERVMGFTADEILGQHSAIFFIPEERASGVPEQELRRAAEEGTAPDVRWHQRSNGTRFFANGMTSAIRGPEGELLGFTKVARDETERRAAEETNASLAAMVRASKDAIFQLDLQTTILSWNPAAEGLFGYTAQEVIGHSVSLIIPDNIKKEPTDFINRIARGDKAVEVETVRLCKDQRLIDVFVTFSPIYDSSGNFNSVAVTARDISERKRIEQERQRLLEQERRARADAEAARESAEAANRLKDEFLATLSHELRTPLNAIVGWSSILRGKDVTAEDYAEGLEAIERNARVQTQLIEDLLDVSRIISGKLRLDVQRVDPAQVIDAAIGSVQPAAQNKDIRLARSIDPTATPVWGDAGRLQQIVWNLLSNAIKFTPHGGRVSVDVSRVDAHIEITVTDTGRGIKAEFLPFVFERFRQADSTTTRKFGGLGLGLAIVRHLAELHGGTVEARSGGEGTGASFVVRLPMTVMNIQPQEVEQTQTTASKEPQHGCPEPQLEGMRVLAVDDESDARNLLRRVLEQCKVVVTTAATVDEATEILEREKFDVVISDIGIPDKDGYELIRRLRAMPPSAGGETPAIALTAFARAEDRKQALQAGFQIHVPKPVDATELLIVLASLSKRYSPSV